MLNHHLKIFFRKLAHWDTTTYINTLGLSIGLTCSMIIMLWIKSELTYDTFHKKINNIYRVQLSNYREGILEDANPITMVPLGPAFLENFPEIQSFTRLKKLGSFSIAYKDNFFNEQDVIAADSSFFNIFSFKLLQGNSATALDDPYSLLLSQSTANKIFGDENPLGKSVVVNGDDHYIVTGIIDPPPENSHIKFNGLISINTLWKEAPCVKWDCNYSFYTYFLLNPNTDVETLEQKFPDFLWEPLNKKNAQVGWREEASLIPLKDIHFKSTSNYELEPPGNIHTIYLFSAIAIFILLIACINFINLTTAQASKKGKEIGIKKVSGASRRHLISQLLGEIFTQTSIALLLSIISLELILPSFNTLLGISMEIKYLSTSFMVGVILILAITTFGSGVYPALLLSKIHPAQILKGNTSLRSRHSKLRNALIVIQFTISIALISGTIIIYNQLQFINNFDLGFDKGNVITVVLPNKETQDQWRNLQHEFNSISEVVSVGASTFVPGGGLTSNGYLPEGFESPMMLSVLDIDENYLETMDIEIIAGRNFSDKFPSDETAFIINEQLANQLNWQDPIGKSIKRNGDHQIIGLIKSFNFSSLHHKMEPLIITKRPWEGYMGYTHLSIRIQSENYTRVIQKLEKAWKSHVSSIPFEYHFLEDRINDQYLTEKRFAKTFIYFSVLAIFISCMGLFGLILFLVDQKTKEIGIRKTLGGSVMHILIILSKDLTKWILVAFAIAVPIIWKIMSIWLSSFAYKTEMNWWIFGLSGGLAILISWLTIGWHTTNAALKNPVDALRYE